uniref:PDZ domain-containing protein n=1 Tax=Eptatretus burgeri TaxID=7764 RepID=A0A8C4QT75_EPTBU
MIEATFAMQALDRLQAKLHTRSRSADSQDSLRATLASPLFQQIVHLQRSVQEFKGTSTDSNLEYGHIHTLDQNASLPWAHEARRAAISLISPGRPVEEVELGKDEDLPGSLGFSIVGLRSKQQGELGIFIQAITESGIAHR